MAPHGGGLPDGAELVWHVRTWRTEYWFVCVWGHRPPRASLRIITSRWLARWHPIDRAGMGDMGICVDGWRRDMVRGLGYDMVARVERRRGARGGYVERGRGKVLMVGSSCDCNREGARPGLGTDLRQRQPQPGVGECIGEASRGAARKVVAPRGKVAGVRQNEHAADWSWGVSRGAACHVAWCARRGGGGGPRSGRTESARFAVW
mmetsp:Transcript_20123/g.42390  ORF Transcript_20123/g.42390 Transcript_20123/m.42390 type:complete len:206 (-) Transcript_20123:1236-1853(-)